MANAEIVLNNAKKNLIDTLQSVYTTADDMVRNKTDQFFNNPRSFNPQLVFSLNDTQLKIELENFIKNSSISLRFYSPPFAA